MIYITAATTIMVSAAVVPVAIPGTDTKLKYLWNTLTGQSPEKTYE
jgi:hypothetical protein